VLKGTYYHTLDEKGRLIMPSRFRELFSPWFVLTRGLEGCLFAYTFRQWDVVVGQLPHEPFASAQARAFTRVFLAGAVDCQLDRQGRVLIPNYLMDHAGLSREKECAVVGQQDRLEIWDRQRWREYEEQAMGNYESLAESMGRNKVKAAGDAG